MVFLIYCLRQGDRGDIGVPGAQGSKGRKVGGYEENI